MSVKKEKIFVLILVLISFIIVASFAEISTRVKFGGLAILRRPDEARESSPKIFHSIFARNVYEKGPATFESAPGIEIHINDKGYRGKNFTRKKAAGVKRILFYGGSQVVDVYADLGQDWPHRIENLLKKHGLHNVEVLNTAVSGNASFDSAGLLWGEGYRFEPDYVVLCNAWNDMRYFRDDETFLRKFTIRSSLFDPRTQYYNSLDRWLSHFSKFYLLCRYVVHQNKFDGEGEIQKSLTNDISENALYQYRLNLNMFIDLARNIGAEPVLMTQPRLFVKDTPEDWRKDIRNDYHGLTYDALIRAADETERIIHDVAAKKGVKVIDASKEMTGWGPYFHDHVHLSADGSEELAHIVAKRFLQILNTKVGQ